jgi:hypothetical protein
MATKSPAPSPNGCPRVDRWFGACEFRPRYDSKPMLPEDFSIEQLTTSTMSDESLDLVTRLLSELKQTTYVQDVCVTCGRVAKREESNG